MLLKVNSVFWWVSVAAVTTFVVVVVSAGHISSSRSPYTASIEACSTTELQEVLQIDCWYSVLRDVFDNEGTQRAFEVFVEIYDGYPVFANSGCHRHAHRVGDMAYYYDYLTHKDLSKVAFPKNASTCGYGFYHGFFEHLVQDVPDLDFVTRTCEFMADILLENAPAIQQTCYHGTGHGLVLAIADELLKPEEWSLQAFTYKPLKFCDSLPKAREKDKEDCRQGVFNVIVDWMADGEYNLSYNLKEPFAVCDIYENVYKPDCYYEIAQKLDKASDFNTVNMVTLVQQIKDPSLQNMAMSVGMAGIVQHDPLGEKSMLLGECLGIPDSLQDACVVGLLGGLVEHGIEGDYITAINFCELEMPSEVRKACYEELQNKLLRFETESTVVGMCDSEVLTKGYCAFHAESMSI